MKDAGKYAMMAFSRAKDIPTATMCTEIRISACLMELTFEDGEYVVLVDRRKRTFFWWEKENRNFRPGSR